jgi:YbbR-like protein
VVEVVGPMSLLKDLKSATTEPVSIARATTAVRDTVTVGVANDNLRLREARTAVVTVEIAPVSIERSLSDLGVLARNLPDGRKADIAPRAVKVVVRGPRHRVDALDEHTVTPNIDCTGLRPGRFTLPVKVEAANVEVIHVEPTSVRVTIH